MKLRRGRSRPSNEQFSKDQVVATEALVERSGSPGGRLPALLVRKRDQMSLVRYATLAEGKGRSITRTIERSLLALGYVTEKQKRHARRVALSLQSWCSRRGLPQFVEVVHRRNARLFIRDLVATGYEQRTVDNYRSVLSRLWDHIASIEAEFIRNASHPLSWEASSPLENPWRGLKVTTARAKTVQRGPAVEKPLGSTQGLLEGPKATRRYAIQRAYRLRLTLRALSQKGIVSNSGIARALNQMGERTPRGNLWDATGVRRLKARCNWNHK